MSQPNHDEKVTAAEKALALGISAVQTACIACVRVQRELHAKDVASKEDDTPVTIADYAAQAIIAWVLQHSCDTRCGLLYKDCSSLAGVCSGQHRC
jgi:3'-phosphoadenosine 5'-phosphosulfate (PAPS) 3'-phosphatase